MDPTIALVICCAVAPAGLGAAWLLGLMGKKETDASSLGRQTGGRPRGWLANWLGGKSR